MTDFIEYLMVYGWAILMILIVAGVLIYFGFFGGFFDREDLYGKPEPEKQFLEMNCEELLQNYYNWPLNNEYHIRNRIEILNIMQLKNCNVD